MSHAKIVLMLLWLVALGLTAWVLSQLPLVAILQRIEALTLGQWLAWAGLNVGVIVLLTWRWQVLSAVPGKTPGFYALLQIRQAGQSVSFLTPGPQFGGEPLQIYWLWKHHGVQVHHAVLGVGLDRFYELWVNLSVLLLALLLLPLLSVSAVVVENWLEIFLVLALLLAVLSFGAWIMLQRPSWVSTCIKTLTSPWQYHARLQQVGSHWQSLGSDLARLVREEKPALLKAFMLSLCGWGAMLGELELLLIFLDVPMDFTTFLVIFVATRLAFLLPLPAGVGTLEVAVFWVFQSLGLPPSAAIGLIALMRLRDVVILMAGLFFMRRLIQLNKQHSELLITNA